MTVTMTHSHTRQVRWTHLVVMVLAEAHPILKDGQQRVVRMEGLGERDGGAGVAGAAGQVQGLHQPFDEVVFGQADSLVCADTVVAEVLLAVQAVGGSRVAFVAGAAVGVPEAVETVQAPMRVVVATAPTPASVLVLLFGRHHHIQQVAEEEIGRRQGVHPRLGD